MKKYGVNELREMFLSFFESKGHLRLPSFSLIPQGDASLLLINSGMAPMKPYFKGEQVPPRKRVCTCQKCIRTGDIDNIGKTARHGTYFEMLGNFSFGDYFKNEAIAWSWEFLTSSEWVGLDPNRLYPSIYVDDDEAFEIWNKKIGIPENRIFRFGKADNFWEHGAGPCGPCSEIYYDRGERYGCGKPDCTVGCDCDRYMEVWNNVFSQFDNDGNGNYTELVQKNIDTGMGLERLAVVCQDVDSLFDVDTVMNITNKVSELTGAYYGKSNKMDVSLRVITDHIRSASFMICDGVLPSNVGRGYVLRRLLRRAARHGKLLGVNEPFLYKVIETVVNENKFQYPELCDKYEYIVRVVKTEEESFAKTIDSGLRIFNEMMSTAKANSATVFAAADAFKLYDTYGFPLDLTVEMCEDEGLNVDEEGFKTLMKKQKEDARTARLALGDLGWKGISFGKEIPETEFVGYYDNATEAKVLAIISDDEARNEVGAGSEAIIVLDKTVLYAEMGGQCADHGKLIAEDFEAEVYDVQKNAGGKYMHYCCIKTGLVKLGDTVTASYCKVRRAAVMRAHSATHLLQKALREVCGDHVHQAGSLVEPDRLRFDFTAFEAVKPEQLREVEAIVNSQILAAFPITVKEMGIEEAKKSGATALFDSKYGNIVRVVNMGDWSIELCGGTHAANTSQIGHLHIVSEGSVASGVRRIEAVTGKETQAVLCSALDSLGDIASFLKVSEKDIISKLTQMTVELKEQQKIIDSYRDKELSMTAKSIVSSMEDINGRKFAASMVDVADTNALRKLGDLVRDADDMAVAVMALRSGDKISLLCVCGKDAVKKGTKAGDIIKQIAPIIGGKGGGKPDSAMGGGSDFNKIPAAFEAAKSIIGG